MLKERILGLIGHQLWAQLSLSDIPKLQIGVSSLFLKPDKSGFYILWQRQQGDIWLAFREYSNHSIKKIIMETLYHPKYRNTISTQQAHDIISPEMLMVTLREIETYQSQETSNLSTHEST